MATKSTLEEKLQEAHDALQEDIAELEQMLSVMKPIAAEKLADRLRSFRRDLATHFQFEEQSAYLKPIVSCRPEKDAEARAILDEHGRLLMLLDEMIDDAADGRGLTSESRERVQHWLHELRKHKAHETNFFDHARDDEPC